ncbi:type I-U CRISPR-associated RAMP protein Csb1/Cas7u [Chamaesiphon sp.]|uniref:type I-G CRISPR-associated RAMP protein Csb1/Cas7g n=1 Tax=Chamaesiphon sp. TaxID=2814140 RepID=UPI00359387B9
MQLDFISFDANTTIDITFNVRGLFNASTFPNVGQLIYNDGTHDCLVLDSFASVSNMLEGTIQLPGTQTPIFAGLPHIRMVDDLGRYLSTSIILPHRLASGYLLKNKSAMLHDVRFGEAIGQEIMSNGLHLTVLKYCPMSLLHGVWFSQIEGHHKIAKSIGGSLIAIDVREALVGGLLRDRVWSNASTLDLTNFDDGAGKASELGIGMIPHNTKRFSCARVEGYFQITDLQIDAYQIPELGKRLITGLAVYEILKFIETVPIHRVDCSLQVVDVRVNQPLKVGEIELNRSVDAKKIVEDLLLECRKDGIIGNVETVKVTLNRNPPKSKEKPHTPSKRQPKNADDQNRSQ